MTHTDISTRLYNYGIQLLARREHSIHEVRHKLHNKYSAASEYSISERETVIERLISAGYLSDERFAEAYVRSRKNKGFGAARMVMELQSKGISATVSDAVLASIDDDQWLTVIAQVWRKKFSQPPIDYAERAKQQRFLYYRGFGGDVIEAFFVRLEAGDTFSG